MENYVIGRSLAELQELALSLGLKKFVGKQLAEWLYQKKITAFEQMTNLSLSARSVLAEHYQLGRCSFETELISADGTRKYLFPVLSSSSSARQYVEAVYIPEADRATLCVSTQVGCKMGCHFCMTGKLGFHGQLLAADILNQIFTIDTHVQQLGLQALTNIVVMGEGEPCDNIEQVLQALSVMTSDWGCAWSPRRITVSSVGYLPGLTQLLDLTECHIAISLHNAVPEERQSIMPIEKVYPIEQVIAHLRQYDFAHQRRLSFEYICFGLRNTDLRHAMAIRRLLDGLDARVNLIRFHQASSDSAIQNTSSDMPSSDESQMVWLRDYLTENGLTTTIRRSRGEDIFAACGMLISARKNSD